MVRRFQHHDIEPIFHLVQRVTVGVPFAINADCLDNVDAKPKHRTILQRHPNGGLAYLRDVYHLGVDGLPRTRVSDAS